MMTAVDSGYVRGKNMRASKFDRNVSTRMTIQYDSSGRGIHTLGLVRGDSTETPIGRVVGGVGRSDYRIRTTVQPTPNQHYSYFPIAGVDE